MEDVRLQASEPQLAAKLSAAPAQLIWIGFGSDQVIKNGNRNSNRAQLSAPECGTWQTRGRAA